MSLRISAEERRARLADRHRLLLRTRTDDLPQIADDLVALHSSDPVSVFLSAMARMVHPSVEAVEEALYTDRSLIRHHGMRRTLWVATPPVVRLMHAAATRDLLATERRRTGQLLAASGVADPELWLAEAEEQVLADLRRHGPSTAREIGQRSTPCASGCISHRARRTPRCSRPTPGSSTSSALLARCYEAGPAAGSTAPTDTSTRSPGSPVGSEISTRRQAAGELAGRWLQRFGPATTIDLQWWMGWTIRRTKQALVDCGAVEAELDSGPGWLAADAAPHAGRAVDSGAARTGSTIMGWKQRDWYLPDTSREVFDSAGNGGPSLWVDGRVVGAWAQTKDGTIHTHYFERVAAARRREISQRIEDLKSWIGDTRFTARFPGDIHARLLGTRTVPGPITAATKPCDRRLGAYAGRVRARAGSAALAVILLTGCEASADNPQPSPSPVSSTGSALLHLMPVEHLPRVPRRPITQFRWCWPSMPAGLWPMWR